jgi:TRAP-type C4-dicarboxylate transport system substrate-binding protein
VRAAARGALCAALAVSTGARAADTKFVLRMATVAPEGTAWARELKAFAREVENNTEGLVRVKWYLGAVAGDDVQAGERIRRDQLDGVASGGMLCKELAPSMRVTRVPGLLQGRAESAFVLARLKPTLDEEFQRSGFINLFEVGLGPEIILSVSPVRSLSDLKRGRYWVWDRDDVLISQLTEIGVHVVPLPLEEAARALDQKRIDGFIAIPSAALAFQWSAQVKHVSALHVGFLSGCVILSNRAYDQLPSTAQSALRAAAVRMHARAEQVAAETDEALLGHLFEKQGLSRSPVSDAFRSEFLMSARGARERLDATRVAPSLLARVVELLADYRAEHGKEDAQ